MSMREVTAEVDFASSVFTEPTLSDHMQRPLRSTRVKKHIVGYLRSQNDRFFGSLVVAAVGGAPRWHPFEIPDDPASPVLAHGSVFSGYLGLLTFGDDPKYYALDGQHRLAAIRRIVQSDQDHDFREAFSKETISVLVLFPSGAEGADEADSGWQQRYRRVFSSLNRWTKATGQVTNIIMDEDDRFAIVTRRLISEHELFRAPGPDSESFRVLTKSGQLKATSDHFITLKTLYDVNTHLLLSADRRALGQWDLKGQKALLLQQRPTEEELEGFFTELCAYWDGLLDVFPALGERRPSRMREHDSSKHDSGRTDHVGFWRIGQMVLVRLVREVLDQKMAGEVTPRRVAAALKCMANVPLELHKVPWRHVLLVGPDEGGAWKMRSEDRKPAENCCLRLCLWMSSVLEANEARLRAEWENLLYPRPVASEVETLWQDIRAIRQGADD